MNGKARVLFPYYFFAFLGAAAGFGFFFGGAAGFFAAGRLSDLPAALFDADSRPIRIIEIGGIYSADDLRRMHRSYIRERIRYELW